MLSGRFFEKTLNDMKERKREGGKRRKKLRERLSGVNKIKYNDKKEEGIRKVERSKDGKKWERKWNKKETKEK